MKLTEIRTQAGVKDLYTLLDFLNNKAEYASRLDKMEQFREELNQKIEALGGLKDIERNRDAAVADRSRAKLQLDQTKAKVKEMMTDVDAAIQENERRSKELDAREADIKKASGSVKLQQQSLLSRKQSLESKYSELIGQAREEKEKAERIRNELQEKAEKLKKAAAAV